ncbi:MAG TPA: hypothetical protein VGP26_07345 [Actinophytocola sp.]|nr:hypothetical protein [Actinophytocola sp.]
MRKRLLWPWLAAVIALVVVAGTFTYGFWITADHGVRGVAGTPVGITDPHTPLRQAFSACHSGDLADADHTLVIDTAGEDYGTGSDTDDGLMCTLGELRTPQAVIAQLEHTRALDGMQTAAWDVYGARWTYHPDNGVDLIITEKS